MNTGIDTGSGNVSGPADDSVYRAEQQGKSDKAALDSARRAGAAATKAAEDADSNPSVRSAKSGKDTHVRPPTRTQKNTAGFSVLVREEDARQFAGDFSKRQENLFYHIPVNKFSKIIQTIGNHLINDHSANGIVHFIEEGLKSADLRPADPVHVDMLFTLLLEIAEFAPYYDDITAAKALFFHENQTNIELTKRLVEGGYVEALVQEGGESFEGSTTILRDMIETTMDVFQLRRQNESEGKTFKQQMDGINKILTLIGKRLRTFAPLPKGEQQALIQSIKTYQAYIGVHRPFKQSMSLVRNQLRAANFSVNSDLNFAILAAIFLQIAEIPYVNAGHILEKIQQYVEQINIPQA